MTEGIMTASGYLDTAAVLRRLGLVPGLWVGDFGVGAAAHLVPEMAKIVGDQGGVVMFDVVKSALSGAMSRIKLDGLMNCRAVWTNLEIYGGAHGVTEGTLDVGLCMNVLHQSTKAKDVLAEMARMLKTGARLLVVDWKPETQSTIAPAPDRRLADGYVEQLAKAVGFAPGERFEAGPYHWGLVVVKT